jgi:DnaJ-class molecular chaperone
MAEKEDFYKVLGIDRNASDAEIKKKYRKEEKEYGIFVIDILFTMIG